MVVALSRVVEVVSPEARTRGSGYLIAERLILTAYHVAAPDGLGGRLLEVTRLQGPGQDPIRYRAELLWPAGSTGTGGASHHVDAALVRITDPNWVDTELEPVEFGAMPRQVDLPCWAVGYPKGMFWNNIQDTLLTRAKLGQGMAVKRGMIEIIVDTEHIPIAHTGLDFWDGASGSAVWCGGTLLGVLVLNRGKERRDATGAPWLAAARIDHLLTIRRFREALVAHGVAPVVHEITHPRARPELFDDTLPAVAPHAAADHPVAPDRSSWLRPANVLLLFGVSVLFAQLWTPAARSDGLTAVGLLAMLGAGLRLLRRKPEEAEEAGAAPGPPQAGVEEALRAGFRIAVTRRRQNLLPYGEPGKPSRPAIDVTFQLHPTARLQPLRASAHGSFSTVADYYLDLDPRRLVITGGAGSGKTLLALELANSLLQQESAPLAYVISLADWNPDEASFLDWAATATADALEGVDIRAVRELIRTSRLVPVLDGLDEMDPLASDDLRALRALQAMEEYSGAYVLTCRREAFARLESVSGEAFLPASAVVLVDPVDSGSAREYLRKRNVDASELVGLEAESDTDLNSPWLLSLAGDILGGEHGGEPHQGPAADSRPFAGANTAQELRRRLISQLVPAKVAQQRPGRGRHAYSEESALHWLSVLARFMVTEGVPTFPGHSPSRQDIVPHRLWPITGPRSPRTAAALLTVLLWIPLLACLAVDFAKRGMFPQPGAELLLLVASLPTASAWAVQRRWVQPRNINPARLRSRMGLSRIGLGGIVGGTSGLIVARFTDPAFGLAFGGGFASVFGLGFAVSVRKDVHTRVVAVFGVATALVMGGLTGVLLARFGAVSGLAAGWGAGALGLLLGIPRGIALRQRRAGGMPDPEYDGVPTPSTAVHRDFLVGTMAGIPGFGLALYIGLAEPWFSLPPGLAAATAAAAWLGSGPGFVSEVSRSYAGMLLIARGRQLPWRLNAFLNWAADVGLLRVTARAYQFRHDELRDWLAERPAG